MHEPYVYQVRRRRAIVSEQSRLGHVWVELVPATQFRAFLSATSLRRDADNQRLTPGATRMCGFDRFGDGFPLNRVEFAVLEFDYSDRLHQSLAEVDLFAVLGALDDVCRTLATWAGTAIVKPPMRSSIEYAKGIVRSGKTAGRIVATARVEPRGIAALGSTAAPVRSVLKAHE